jgi:hypothetical protein
MTVLIEVRNARGHVVRQCGERCHAGKPLPPGGKSGCICNGLFRGMVYRGQDPEAIPYGLLMAAREAAELRPGESIQLRFGA